MRQLHFRFTPLAAGVIATFSIPVNASLLDDAAAPVTVHEMENVSTHQIRGYDVAAQPEGGFAVIWAEDYNYEDYEDSVVLQRFDASGNASGDALTLYQRDVSQGTTHFNAPAVAADEDGDLVVAWTTPGAYCFGDLFIQTLAVDSDWSNLPEPTLVSEKGCKPKLAVDADGDFALTWLDRTGNSRETNALLRTYSASGVPMQDQPLVLVQDNVNTTDTPAIAMQSGGEFLVAWGEDDDNYLYAQRFTIDGNTLDATPVRLDGDALNRGDVRQVNPSLATYKNDGFIAFWAETEPSFDPDVEAVTIRGLRWHADGTPGTATTAGNTLNEEHNSYRQTSAPAVSVDSSGNVLVVWQGSVGGQKPTTHLTQFDEELRIEELDTPFIDPDTMNSSSRFEQAPKLTISGDRSILFWAWPEQEDNKPDSLLARTLPILVSAEDPDEDTSDDPVEENDPTPGDSGSGDNNRGGGTAGSILWGLMMLVGAWRWRDRNRGKR